MTKQMAFLKILALLLGTIFAAVCITAGLSMQLIKSNPAPLRIATTVVSAFTLNNDQKKQRIVKQLEKIETVESVEIQEIVDQDYTELRILVLSSVQHDNDATSQAVAQVCAEAQNFWLSLSPRSITCTLSTR